MERLLRKYRFLIVGCILRVTSAFLSSEVYYYNIINYSLPDNFFQLILSLFILICDISFMIDCILYYITIKDIVCLRISKQRYYCIILCNTFVAISLLVLAQLFIPLIWFNVFILRHIIIYTMTILIMFFICFSVKENIHENISIIIITIVSMLLRIIYF